MKTIQTELGLFMVPDCAPVVETPTASYRCTRCGLVLDWLDARLVGLGWIWHADLGEGLIPEPTAALCGPMLEELVT